MVCIYCKHKTKVANSRTQKKSNHVWRRRQCLVCNSVWTTTESAYLETSFAVQKHTRIEPFSRDKLLVSVYDSCKHRKTAQKDATELTATIIAKLLADTSSSVIDSLNIQHITQEVLGRFDQVAQVHYAAFHPDNY